MEVAVLPVTSQRFKGNKQGEHWQCSWTQEGGQEKILTSRVGLRFILEQYNNENVGNPGEIRVDIKKKLRNIVLSL